MTVICFTEPFLVRLLHHVRRFFPPSITKLISPSYLCGFAFQSHLEITSLKLEIERAPLSDKIQSRPCESTVQTFKMCSTKFIWIVLISRKFLKLPRNKSINKSVLMFRRFYPAEITLRLWSEKLSDDNDIQTEERRGVQTDNKLKVKPQRLWLYLTEI